MRQKWTRDLTQHRVLTIATNSFRKRVRRRLRVKRLTLLFSSILSLLTFLSKNLCWIFFAYDVILDVGSILKIHSQKCPNWTPNVQKMSPNFGRSIQNSPRNGLGRPLDPQGGHKRLSEGQRKRPRKRQMGPRGGQETQKARVHLFLVRSQNSPKSVKIQWYDYFYLKTAMCPFIIELSRLSSVRRAEKNSKI